MSCGGTSGCVWWGCWQDPAIAPGKYLRDLLAKTPVNELEVRAHPRVFFRVDEVTWIDAIVRYVVPPKEAGSIKTRLIPKLLAALNAEPDKVMFPAGANR